MSGKACRIAVLGAGSWGTALASVLARKGHETVLWGRDEETIAAINAKRRNPRYLPDIAVDIPLDQAFKKYRAGDIRRRLTGRGPHRDDLEILVNDQPARNFGSQGQQKTAALALKLAEIELIRARIGEYPVLMLDEVLAELDDKRVNHLLKAIPEKVQCLMTTTDLSDRLPAFGSDAQLYRIEGGRLEEE